MDASRCDRAACPRTPSSAAQSAAPDPADLCPLVPLCSLWWNHVLIAAATAIDVRLNGAGRWPRVALGPCVLCALCVSIIS